MATIRQLKTKRWQAIIRRQGSPNQYKTFIIINDHIYFIKLYDVISSMKFYNFK